MHVRRITESSTYAWIKDYPYTWIKALPPMRRAAALAIVARSLPFVECDARRISRSTRSKGLAAAEIAGSHGTGVGTAFESSLTVGAYRFPRSAKPGSTALSSSIERSSRSRRYGSSSGG
jgi:hypothetical protein